MKAIALIAAAACVCSCAFALTGCNAVPGKSNAVGYVVDYVEVSVEGKTLTVTMEGNPTTGFEWTADLDGDTLVAKDEQFKSKGDKINSGAGGTYTFVYEGVKEGTSTIVFKYERSWEKYPGDKELVVKVDTNASGKITATKTKSEKGSEGSSEY